MDINFEYYKIFYYVAKYCNFTKAARALGNSQPNVTRAMNNLEQQINSILFIRNNRGVQLTPEGERLYAHVSAAMSQILAAEEELSDSTGSRWFYFDWFTGSCPSINDHKKPAVSGDDDVA